MDNFEVTAVVTTDHVGVVTFSRPPHNYFTVALVKRIGLELYRVQSEGARSAVLRGVGRHFCAGMDFGASDSGAARDLASLYDAGLSLFRLAIPTVAEVRGAAIGGGLGLSLAADFRVATPSSKFAANFARLGIHQGFGLSLTLPRLVGAQRAAEMLYTGRAIRGPEALDIGLCDRLVAEDELTEAAYGLAAELAASAPLAVNAIRRTLRADLVARVERTMIEERHEQETLMRTEDFLEGTAASSERRTAIFHAR